MTDDTQDNIPRWCTTRDTAYRNTCVLPVGHVFYGDPAAQGIPFGSYEPLNAAARSWQSGYLRGPERPKWRATKRTIVNDRVVEAGTEFGSDRWPDADWMAVNEPAREVDQYHKQHRSNGLPLKAWVDDALNTREAEAARNYKPPPEPLPEWPYGGPIPPSAKGFRPREEPSSFTPSMSPSTVKFPPRTFVRPK